MAATVTVEEVKKAGQPRVLIIKVVETSAGAATEWNTTAATDAKSGHPFTDWPEAGALTWRVSNANGRNIQPRLGMGAAWADGDANDLDGAAAATAPYSYEGQPLEFAFPLGQKRNFYGQSRSASGSDNTVTWTIKVVEG